MKTKYFLSKLSRPAFGLVLMRQRDPLPRYPTEVTYFQIPRAKNISLFMALFLQQCRHGFHYSFQASVLAVWSVFADFFDSTGGMNRDPDKDTKINLLEFTFGLNPNQPESQPLVEISLKDINGVDYTVQNHPPVSPLSDSTPSPEGKRVLGEYAW